MGLKEKRLAEDIKTTKVVEVLKILETTTGFPITLDIDWDSFTIYDEYALTRLRDSFFRDLLEGIKLVAKDQMGKDALKARVQTIKIVCTDDTKGAKMELLPDSVFSFVIQTAGSNFSFPSAAKIRDYLEKNL
jgi:hypothetical protein